jgi:hypothetical protein
VRLKTRARALSRSKKKKNNAHSAASRDEKQWQHLVSCWDAGKIPQDATAGSIRRYHTIRQALTPGASQFEIFVLKPS